MNIKPYTIKYCSETQAILHKIFLQQTEGVWSTGVIPRGTKFGPFEGTRTPNKPNDKVSWRYYWRVRIIFCYITLITFCFHL